MAEKSTGRPMWNLASGSVTFCAPKKPSKHTKVESYIHEGTVCTCIRGLDTVYMY